jgi:hypothetical protein
MYEFLNIYKQRSLDQISHPKEIKKFSQLTFNLINIEFTCSTNKKIDLISDIL